MIVTISFEEDSEMQVPLFSYGDKKSREVPGSWGINILGNKPQSVSIKALHGKAKVGNSSAKDDKYNSTKASRSRQNDTCERQMDVVGTKEAPPAHCWGMSEEDDDWYQFSYQIEEEPAPEEPLA